MKPLIAALGLLAMVSPVMATAQNVSAYEAGVAARRAGKPDEARRLLTAWLAEHPDDVDARLQLAYAELALGNRATARAGFEEVLRRAPDYADARDGLAQVAASEMSPDVAGKGQFLIEGALSDLSAPAENWSELVADVTLPTGGRTSLGARAAHYRRFGLDDFELVGRIGARVAENVWLRAHAGFTPEADFRPELAFGAGTDLRLSSDGDTVLTLDAEYQRFPLQDVFTVNPGLVHYFDEGRAWITLRGIGTVADGGPLLAGGLVRGDYAPMQGWRLFGGAANGPDTDLGVVTRVTSLFGGFEAPLGDGFGVVTSIARDWRETGADRTEVRVGLKVRL